MKRQTLSIIFVSRRANSQNRLIFSLCRRVYSFKEPLNTAQRDNRIAAHILPMPKITIALSILNLPETLFPVYRILHKKISFP